MACYLSTVCADPAPSPSCLSGKARKLKEGGNTGRRTIGSCRCHFGPKAMSEALRFGNSGRPFSSRPGSSGNRRYKGFEPECNRERCPPQGSAPTPNVNLCGGAGGRPLDIGPICGV